MVPRLKLGLIFTFDPKWIAGAYYVMNLVESFGLLAENQKPHLVIISNKADFQKILALNYPYVSHFECVKKQSITILKKGINKFTRTIWKKNAFTWKEFLSKLTKQEVDYIFPIMGDMPNLQKHFDQDIPLLYWIPDFQEKYYPHFFSTEELNTRNEFQRKLANMKVPVVFSSETARNDFEKFFPLNQTRKIIYQFSVFHPDISMLDSEEIKAIYTIKDKYFFCPNQFWQHKNQLLVLKALLQLKQEGIIIQVVFSGKEYDHRNGNYFESLKEFVLQNELENQVKFVGFIPREDQLILLKNAHAVIQPSLFEGWSTVVEDCKLQNQYLILSDIPVHREQIVQNVSFFDACNSTNLANLMLEIWNKNVDIEALDYSTGRLEKIVDFQENLQNTMRLITDKNLVI